jgi:hypothetical protein
MQADTRKPKTLPVPFCQLLLLYRREVGSGIILRETVPLRHPLEQAIDRPKPQIMAFTLVKLKLLSGI